MIHRRAVLYFFQLFIISFPFQSFTQHRKGFAVPGENKIKEKGSTYALVIGISKYKDPSIPALEYADKDAIAFYEYLLSTGVDSAKITLLINEKARCSDILLNSYQLCVETVKAGDKLHFYFSGHGDVESKVISNLGYLLPYDAPSRIYSISAIDMRTIQDYMSTASAKGVEVVFITDACRSGNLAGGVDGLKNIQNVLKEKWKDEIKILSCQPGEISIEGKQWGQGRGLFSYELIRGLSGFSDKNKDGQISLYELQLYLAERVHEQASPVPQNPMVIGDMESNLGPVNEKYYALFTTDSPQPMFSAIKTKGTEESLVKNLPDSIRDIYRLFQTCLDSHLLNIYDNYLIHKDSSGKSYAFEYLKAIPSNDSTKLLISLMKRELAAHMVNAIFSDVNEVYKLYNSYGGFYFSGNSYRNELYELLGKEKVRALGLEPRMYFLESMIFQFVNQGELQVMVKTKPELLDSALLLDPQAVYALYFKAQLLYEKYNNPLESAPLAKKVIELAPTFSSAYQILFRSLRDLNNIDSALTVIDKFSMLDSSCKEDAKIEKYILFVLNENPDSISAYNLQNRFTNEREVNLLIAQGFLDREKYAKAIEYFLKTGEFLNSSNLYNISCCYSILNDIEKSLKYLELSLQKSNMYFDHIQNDPDLENIRPTPQFHALMKKYFPDKFR